MPLSKIVAVIIKEAPVAVVERIRSAITLAATKEAMAALGSSFKAPIMLAVAVALERDTNRTQPMGEMAELVVVVMAPE
tara:strand:+ start:342 stop:578 length:237 start_codon:yes stop_codon:yes gene_type:complete